MNWVLIAVGLILLIGFVVGIVRGGVRIAVSLLTTLVTILAVIFVAPYVAKVIADKTPMDDMIKDKVSSTMVSAAQSKLLSTIEEGSLSENDVKDILDAAGVSPEKLNDYGISVEDIVNGNVDSEQLSVLGISDELLEKAKGDEMLVGDIPREVQQSTIKEADLPDVFKNLLETNNNDVIYEELGVKTFADYVGNYLAKLIIHIVSFLGSFLIITIVLRAVVFALDIVADLPVLGIINRLVGAVIGVAGALIIVWVLFVAVTLLYTTAIGKDIYQTIQTEPVLRMIYDYNPVMKLATKV